MSDPEWAFKLTGNGADEIIKFDDAVQFVVNETGQSETESFEALQAVFYAVFCGEEGPTEYQAGPFTLTPHECTDPD